MQRSGGRIRINVQLIDAKTDAHLWAETYTRELTATNVFEIQSEIAGSIAQALKAELSPEAQQRLGNLPTENLAALEAYFKGGIASDSRTDDGFREAIGHYNEAIRLDPDFAEAHAGLARSYLNRVYYSGMPAEAQAAKARPHLLKAIELDPKLSQAYVAKGHYHYELREFEDADAAYEKAIELNPNNHMAYLMYGVLMRWGTGDLQGAVQYFTKAVELSPNVKVIQRNLASAYVSSGRFEAGRAIFASMRESWTTRNRSSRKRCRSRTFSPGLFSTLPSPT